LYSVFSASGVTASFGEMLLLMAIHFHSNQLSAICELVCSTLGMKVSAVYVCIGLPQFCKWYSYILHMISFTLYGIDGHKLSRLFISLPVRICKRIVRAYAWFKVVYGF
jgi:hypothetical protein